MCWRACGEDVSFTDVKIKIPDRTTDVNDVMHRKRARWILGDLKKSVELRTRHQTGRVDFRGSQRPDKFARYGRCTRWGEADGKARIERMCISLPYVEEPLNSKVIKSFVSELRSRKCFSCFGIPMFYVYMLWTFYVRFTYPYHEYGT